MQNHPKMDPETVRLLRLMTHLENLKMAHKRAPEVKNIERMIDNEIQEVMRKDAIYKIPPSVYN